MEYIKKGIQSSSKAVLTVLGYSTPMQRIVESLPTTKVVKSVLENKFNCLTWISSVKDMLSQFTRWTLG